MAKKEASKKKSVKKTPKGKVTKTKKATGKKPKGKKPNSETGITQKYHIKAKYQNAVQYAKEATKSLRGTGKIVTGADVDEIQARKERTGLPFIDYVTNDGLIRGGVAQLWGAFGSTKTTVLAHIIKNFQQRGMTVALASIERFVKPWWRQIGVYIPYGEKEMSLLKDEDRKRAIKYNEFFEDKGTPPLTLIVHQDSVQSLELVYRAQASNNFDLIAVDSLGAVVDSSQVDGKNIADRSYGGASLIFTDFSKKVTAARNYTYNEKNERDPTGSRANQTMMVLLNQARQTIDRPPKCTWDKKIHPVGGEALHHLWDQSMAFQRADDMKEAQSYDGKTKPNVFAKNFDLKGTKMRNGPEQRELRYMLSLKNHEHSKRVLRAGQFDLQGSLRAISAMLGVTTQKGSYITFEGTKYQGKDAFERALHKDKVLYGELYDAMAEQALIDSLAGAVPEVWDYVD